MIMIQSWTINVFERHLVETYFIRIESRASFQFNSVEYFKVHVVRFVQRLSLIHLHTSTRKRKHRKKLYVSTTFVEDCM